MYWSREYLVTNSRSSYCYWQSCLDHRVNKSILVKILRESLQCNGCQASGSLYQVTICWGEGASLWALVNQG